jgi:hypothetical protein
MQCQLGTNFLLWQKWSIQFEQVSALTWEFCRLINSATELCRLPVIYKQLINRLCEAPVAYHAAHSNFISSLYLALRQPLMQALDIPTLRFCNYSTDELGD